MPSRLTFVALFVLCAFVSAAYGENEPLFLKLDRTFNVLPRVNNDAAPAFITADHMTGKSGNKMEATGNAELHQDGQAISADRLLYQQDTKQLVAEGGVRLEQKGDVMTGPRLEYNLDSSVGEMTKPEFRLGANNARGGAEVLHMEGKGNYSLHDVVYTTCPAGNDDWLLKMGELDIDRSTQIGEAHNAHVEFKGVPILYSPWMDFPLAGQRKSGVLAPTWGNTVSSGSEITVPVYWNIAPNFDATIAPRWMDKRGILLNDEFRYLEPSYSGEVHWDVLSNDRTTNSSRSREALKHTQNFGSGFTGSLNLNRVSDDAYFRDLSTTDAGTSQVNLLREGVLNYGGGWWNATTRIQSFQTLQNPTIPVGIPYRRTPQFLVTAQQEMAGTKDNFLGEYVNFSHPTSLNGQRLVLYPSMSYPLLSDPGYYLTPKLGFHATSYVMGLNNAAGLPNVSRAMPIFSVDSGMTFERDASFSERDFIQTLEPRAYYVYIPYRDQAALPVFDTAQAPFSFAQMFTENRFLGNDRVGDANQITLALSSRLLEAANGIERLKISVAERFSITTPKVFLVAPTIATSKSDILLGLTGRLTNAFFLDGLLQYNPTQSVTEMYNYSMRYQPEAGKVLNLGYRFTNPNLLSSPSMRQVALSEQWQLFGRWGTVMSWNYSLLEKRLLKGLAGIEYNQACWTTRFVLQRFAIGAVGAVGTGITAATTQYSTGIFIQLELNDLARVGQDPLDDLRRSIPGYTKLNQGAPGGAVQSLQ